VSRTSLSVALVTRNRPELLAQCLASLRSQDVSPHEIVVSDDSADAGASAWNRKLCAEHAARYVEGPRRGLYANRNHVALQCAGTHILTSDDDHLHPPGYLRDVCSLVARDPRRIWTFGQRDVGEPPGTIHYPGEYGQRGNARPARDPERSAAIADGCTVYPREVFDSGARYCDFYRFGDLYLLWGHELRLRGWQVTISGTVHVVHRPEASHERAGDAAWLLEQVEANHFVRFACALGVFRTPYSTARACALLARDCLSWRAMSGYRVRVRLPMHRGARALARGVSYAARLRRL
jgi:glycosyltransferase involved in cell wall biosynthesis